MFSWPEKRSKCEVFSKQLRCSYGGRGVVWQYLNQFLRDTLAKIIGFLDLNIGAAHFNYSSKYTDTKNATTLYCYICLAIGIISLFGIIIVCKVGFSSYLWPGQKIGYIYAGALLAYSMSLTEVLTQLSDSKEATVGFEIRRVIVMIIGFMGLLALFSQRVLNLSTYFTLQIFIYFLFILVSTSYLRAKNVFKFKFVKIDSEELKKILKYFYSYSHPLLFLSLFGLFCGFFDRWFLQTISGSSAQGYYSLAFRLSSICLLFSGAIAPIFMQSIAKAHGQNNINYIRELFNKSKLFYFISAFLSVFFFFHTNQLIHLIGGQEYSKASVPLMIMLLSPIHQTYGQLCGGALVSLGRTDIYRNIGVISAVVGAIVSYFLMAPGSYFIPGMNLGPVGLALKVVVVQIISVNFILFAVCRVISEPFMKNLYAQIITIIPLFVIGYILKIFENSFYNQQNAGIIETLSCLLISGFCYLFFVVIICLAFPKLMGLKRHELMHYKNTILSYLK